MLATVGSCCWLVFICVVDSGTEGKLMRAMILCHDLHTILRVACH